MPSREHLINSEQKLERAEEAALISPLMKEKILALADREGKLRSELGRFFRGPQADKSQGVFLNWLKQDRIEGVNPRKWLEFAKWLDFPLEWLFDDDQPLPKDTGGIPRRDERALREIADRARRIGPETFLGNYDRALAFMAANVPRPADQEGYEGGELVKDTEAKKGRKKGG